MSFIHPYWLFGLLAIAIPIIIHLFNFRRYKKYYFTNLKFLKSIKKETQKQHRIRHLLILISRIMVITFLVLAFARPYFPGPQGIQQASSSLISIYVDNSMSMQATASGHSLLDEALANAAEVAAAYDASDRFQLITNDFKAKHQAYYNRDEFNKLLREVRISANRRTLPEVYERMLELAPRHSDKNLHFYVISDFQRSSMDFSTIGKDTSAMVFLMPMIKEKLDNVYIDSCWFATPYNHIGQRQELHVNIINASELDLEKIPVRLNIMDQQRALSTFDIAAGSKAEVSLTFSNREAGIRKGEVMIDDYPITWDDHMYLSWEVKDRIPVLAIFENESGFYLYSLFSNDSVFLYAEDELNKLNYSRFKEMDLIVLDNITSISSGMASELEQYIQSGGSVLLFPGQEAQLLSINELLAKMQAGQFLPFDTSKLLVTGLDFGHEIFADVFESVPENLDLPIVKGHFPLNNYRNSFTDVIMDLQNADPLITLTHYGKGKLFLISTPLGDAYGNLARHALWVPLLYRMAMLSRPGNQLYYTIGVENSLQTGSINLSGDQTLLVKSDASEYEFIPGFREGRESAELFLHDQIKADGHYTLLASDKIIKGFSYNYDRQESDPAIYTLAEIQEGIRAMPTENVFVFETGKEPLSQSVAVFSLGTELWKLFILLALIFVLLEVMLLRFFPK